MKSRAFVKESAKLVERAVEKVLEDWECTRVRDEESITNRLCANVQRELDGKIVKGVRWRGKTLSHRGKNSEETRFGADILGVLTVDLKGYHVRKGFLAQAKRLDKGRKLSATDFERLQSQCGKMLNVTPDSFVFAYTREKFLVVPATTVLGIDGFDLNRVYYHSIGSFYEEHFKSFIGDPRLSEASSDALNDTLLPFEYRVYLELIAREANEVQEKTD